VADAGLPPSDESWELAFAGKPAVTPRGETKAAKARAAHAAQPTQPTSPTKRAAKVGTASDVPAGDVPAGDAQASSGAPTNCKWCKSELPKRDNLHFCPFCGMDVNLVPCPSCGEKLEKAWRFCFACGTAVAQES
jgi:hypothetical protein